MAEGSALCEQLWEEGVGKRRKCGPQGKTVDAQDSVSPLHRQLKNKVQTSPGGQIGLVTTPALSTHTQEPPGARGNKNGLAPAVPQWPGLIWVLKPQNYGCDNLPSSLNMGTHTLSSLGRSRSQQRK